MNLETTCTAGVCRIYAMLLYAYPREFRAQFGAEMKQVFRDRCRAAFAASDRTPFPLFLLAMAKDWILTSSKERIVSMSTTWNNRLWRTARGLAFAAAMALICVSASAPFLQAYVIPSASMETSLRVGDHVVVHKLGQTREIQRGDLITFRYPVDPRQTFVKRVIGLPGDRIRLADKQVIRNGRRLVEPYARHDTSYTDAFRDNFPGTPTMELPPQGTDMLAHHVDNGEVVVPAGSLFVLGDNRDESLDSRYSGFVPRENVIGRPVFIYWSYDAPSRDLENWNWRHIGDVAGHFFSKTRWDRTMHPLHTDLPQEVKP